jgi:hypothetical protein
VYAYLAKGEWKLGPWKRTIQQRTKRGDMAQQLAMAPVLMKEQDNINMYLPPSKTCVDSESRIPKPTIRSLLLCGKCMVPHDLDLPLRLAHIRSTYGPQVVVTDEDSLQEVELPGEQHAQAGDVYIDLSSRGVAIPICCCKGSRYT